ncbi:hypothetical protein DPEC_G00352490 [Dallia pectoralis]|uniref:Uncharacterized protein n=1 Tax=Dallia pectoralis TaxID=75939 RepID=A0ACC2F2B9_DALPE|nr:hypothetical protein DPEC_G00352490 [Dallia pectoralis]
MTPQNQTQEPVASGFPITPLTRCLRTGALHGAITGSIYDDLCCCSGCKSTPQSSYAVLLHVDLGCLRTLPHADNGQAQAG